MPWGPDQELRAALLIPGAIGGAIFFALWAFRLVPGIAVPLAALTPPAAIILSLAVGRLFDKD